MRDKTLTVEIPAHMLYDVVALAKGYTMSRGDFIDKSVLRRADELLVRAGYEYGYDTDFLF